MDKQIIGYVSESNPFRDRKAWSGTIYKIREAIENAGYTVIWIKYNGNFSNCVWEKLRKKIMTIFKCDFLGGVHYYPIARKCGKSIDYVSLKQCDYLFFPKDGQIGLFINTNKPIIYYSDATVYNMIDYYWYNVSFISKIMAKFLERKASRKACTNIKSSHWAFDSVIHDCKCPPSHCHVLQYGANIDQCDIKPIKTFKSGTFNMLFSGVDWKRKGGDIAVETMELLRKKGINANLHVVGVSYIPKSLENNHNIIFHGFLDKNNREEYLKYINIWNISHIFILPTRSECAGIVFCEAAAFGVPCYTYNTGGTSDYVVENKNGHCLPTTEKAEGFAKYIFDDIKNDRMSVLHQGALNIYSERLSWNIWSIKFRKIMDSWDRR